MLTGITDAMVSRAPRIESVLPAFLEFAGDCVLVAHNAPFDIGFLKAAAARQELPWPGSRVLDTAHLARQLVGRDEAANRKLATLAQLFGAQATPDHRALHDARATVEVLHALIERVGNLGVTSLEELSAFTSRVTSAQRRKRYLAADVPSGPGVYLFKDNTGRVLYVGTSTDMRRRVRSYFTSTEKAHPDGRDGDAGRGGHPDPLRNCVRGAGARTSPDCRARAAVQPPVSPTAPKAVGQVDR